MRAQGAPANYYYNSNHYDNSDYNNYNNSDHNSSSSSAAASVRTVGAGVRLPHCQG